LTGTVRYFFRKVDEKVALFSDEIGYPALCGDKIHNFCCFSAGRSL
jgi:hypothetical protein